VLPPLEEFVQRLETVWASAWLTNNGPCVQELERALAHELQVPHVVLVANGTLALQLAIRALGFRDSVVTTAFSFVATASSLVWEGCRPVFVDVEPDYFTIDPAAVDAAIGPETRGILATHVYGNPCDVEALEKIATKHGLPILYDAAHTFGATYRGRPVAAFGDAATLSFHATKIFHTVEGGAVVTADPNLAERVRRQRAFGEARPME
jgi:dTDP-4-amino-4,6-dideoxygalactose transaminase